jgi:uncharacterized protein (DUF2062 family)
MNLRKPLLYLYYRCVRIHARPREVAMGMAIGLAVGMTPSLGLQMLAAVALAALLGQSKIAAALGVWISNPVTVPIVYGSTYTVGAWVLGHPLRPPDGFLKTLTSLQGLTSSIFLPLWVGGAILALPVAALGYWLSYQAVVAYRLKVRHRRANRLHKWKWSRHKGWYRVSLASGAEKEDKHGLTTAPWRDRSDPEAPLPRNDEPDVPEPVQLAGGGDPGGPMHRRTGEPSD